MKKPKLTIGDIVHQECGKIAQQYLNTATKQFLGTYGRTDEFTSAFAFTMIAQTLSKFDVVQAIAYHVSERCKKEGYTNE